MFNINIFTANKSRKLYRRVFFAVMLLHCLVLACRQEEARRNDEIVVKVNNHPVYQAEFWERLDSRADMTSSSHISKEAKKACIDIIVERALIVQEAVKEGLNKEKTFIRSVERYWEQTLISNLLKKKEAEFEKMLVVNDDEIVNYYKLMGLKIRYRYCGVNSLQMGQEYLRNINNGEEISWDGETDFLPIEDLPLSLGLELCNKKIGEACVSQTGQDYVVLQVMDQKRVTRKPLEELRDEITQTLMKYKKEVFIQKWVNDLKQNAAIEINETYLK